MKTRNSKDVVDSIRSRLKAGESIVALMSETGLGFSHIYQLANNKGKYNVKPKATTAAGIEFHKEIRAENKKVKTYADYLKEYKQKHPEEYKEILKERKFAQLHMPKMPVESPANLYNKGD